MAVVKKQTITTRKKTVRKKKPTSLLEQARDIEFDSEGLKVALYGRSGTGKTTFWSTFPKPILAIISSGGKRSGELRSVCDVKGIKKFDIEETSQILDLTAELNGSEYKTVVLDHATHLQDLALKEVLGLEEIPAQKSWGLATQSQYGQVSIKMKEYLRSLLDLEQHVIIIAQEREFGSGEESDLIMPTVGPALTPSVTGWLNPACDYIFQTFIRGVVEEKKIKIGGKVKIRKMKGEGVEYCLRTGPNEVYTTKFRVPKGHILPDVVTDPDYDKVARIIQD